MDMKNSNDRSRMKDLFVDYNVLVLSHVVTWIFKENQNSSVLHVLSYIRPKKLKECLESELFFSHLGGERTLK